MNHPAFDLNMRKNSMICSEGQLSQEAYPQRNRPLIYKVLLQLSQWQTQGGNPSPTQCRTEKQGSQVQFSLLHNSGCIVLCRRYDAR